VANRSKKIAKLIVDAGADVNLADTLGVTPLMMACLNKEKVVRPFVSVRAYAFCRWDTPHVPMSDVPVAREGPVASFLTTATVSPFSLCGLVAAGEAHHQGRCQGERGGQERLAGAALRRLRRLVRRVLGHALRRHPRLQVAPTHLRLCFVPATSLVHWPSHLPHALRRHPRLQVRATATFLCFPGCPRDEPTVCVCCTRPLTCPMRVATFFFPAASATDNNGRSAADIAKFKGNHAAFKLLGARKAKVRGRRG
jgi:hypothetical protein